MNCLRAWTDDLLINYFETEKPLNLGIPTVEDIAGQLGQSPRYLSDILRSVTGKNAQQHIHEKLIGKAKDYLLGSKLSVGEIAYQLGFEHSQSFNRLFKLKTGHSPLDFRQNAHAL